MNISIIASYVIGAVVMLTIIMFNVRVSVHSGQETMHIMAKTKVDVISHLVTNDLRKMGYGNNAAILVANATTLSFISDFNNDGSPNTITWQYFPDITIDDTENPNDRQLLRTMDTDVTDFSGQTVTRFEFFYLVNDDGELVETQTPVFSQIRKVRVNVICETEFGYDGVFGASAWQNVITPLNLNF